MSTIAQTTVSDASRAEQFLELFGVNMAVWSDVQCGLPAS